MRMFCFALQLIKLIQMQSKIRQERSQMNSPEINSLIPSRCSCTHLQTGPDFCLAVTTGSVMGNSRIPEAPAKATIQPSATAIMTLWTRHTCSGMFVLGLSLALLGLSSTLRAQVISDNFNSGKDLGWTPYEGSPGTRETRFPTNAD